MLTIILLPLINRLKKEEKRDNIYISIFIDIIILSIL